MAKDSVTGSLLDEMETDEFSESAPADAPHYGPVTNPALKAQLDKEPKRRVGPFDLGEVVGINGVYYIIAPDEEVLVPESIWAVLENTRVGTRELKGKNDRLRRRMEAGPAAATVYVR